MSNIRFEGALWYAPIQKLSCTIVGVGATGSYLAMLLGRAGVKMMNLIDPDYLEAHNLASQLYPMQDLNLSKVAACKKMLTNYTDVYTIKTSEYRIEVVPHLLNSNIITSTLDSMSGRKFCFEGFKASNSAKIFLDSRIGAEYYEVYCVTKDNPSSIEKYEATLFSDEQGNTGACNYQQSSHSANMAACEMVKFVTNYLINQAMEETEHPWKISHDFRTNNYQIFE